METLYLSKGPEFNLVNYCRYGSLHLLCCGLLKVLKIATVGKLIRFFHFYDHVFSGSLAVFQSSKAVVVILNSFLYLYLRWSYFSVYIV